MYELDDLKEVIFSQALKVVGEFLHIDLQRCVSYVRKHSGANLLTPRSLRFFFLADSSPFFLMPFSIGPDSARAAARAGLGFLKVCAGVVEVSATSSAVEAAPTYDIVGGLVARAPKVQIMGDSMVSAAIDSSEDDLHFELAPTLLLQMKRRFLEG